MFERQETSANFTPGMNSVSLNRITGKRHRRRLAQFLFLEILFFMIDTRSYGIHTCLYYIMDLRYKRVAFAKEQNRKEIRLDILQKTGLYLSSPI